MISSNDIRQMKQQGLSNNQIIQHFTKQGYKSAEIFDALNQLSIQPMEPERPNVNPQQNNAPAPQNLPSSPRPSPQSLNTNQPKSYSMADSNEELIEAIIDEKWNDLLEDINKIISWKEKTTQRIDQFEQQFNDMKEQFDKLHQAVIGKVGEYDQHILQVGAEVKAMEKVFSKALPTFTENVNELGRVADVLKDTFSRK